MLAVEPMTDRLLRFLPEWVRDIVQASRCACIPWGSPLFEEASQSHCAAASRPLGIHLTLRSPAPPEQDRRRQLLYVERRMQRRLMNEFRGQVRDLEPVLRARGRM